MRNNRKTSQCLYIELGQAASWTRLGQEPMRKNRRTSVAVEREMCATRVGIHQGKSNSCSIGFKIAVLLDL
jgi:hypothetical protein